MKKTRIHDKTVQIKVQDICNRKNDGNNDEENQNDNTGINNTVGANDAYMASNTK